MNKLKYYTGVGSRETPPDIIEKIKKIAKFMGEQGYILRSGGADGADAAFEIGCGSHPKEIYLPWKGFNGSNSANYMVYGDALLLASKIHPAWFNLTDAAQKLHGRNCYQVLGEDLKHPSSVLICWTHNGEETGGTRTAIVLAKQKGIPVINLAVEKDLSPGKLKTLLS